MTPQGHGHIVFIATTSAEVRGQGSSASVTTRRAIRAFAASLRKEVNAGRVRVTLIGLGALSNDMASGSDADRTNEIAGTDRSCRKT